MKATGIVRRLDDLGRVVIPKELRDNLHFDDGQAVEIFVEGQCVILQKYQPGCVLCGGIKDLEQHKTGKTVCKSCMRGD